jgi:hypothetical protein
VKRALVLLAACGGKTAPAAPVGARVGHAVATALDAADHTRAPWRCAAADLPEMPEATLGAWKIAGHAVTGGDARIAVIADTGGATPETVAALGRLRAKLDVDLVLALGGLGGTQTELETVLGVLATTVPVVAMPGDLEAMPAQIAAIAALRAKGSPVIDGRLVRQIHLATGEIAIVAGAGAPERLVAGADGCIYTPADVAAAFAALTPRDGVRILASAEAPRRVIEGDATGEIGLVPPVGAQIDIALHGGVDRDASAAAKGGHDGAATALTPGSADAGTRLVSPHLPSAGILTVRGGAWTWTPIHDGK